MYEAGDTLPAYDQSAWSRAWLSAESAKMTGGWDGRGGRGTPPQVLTAAGQHENADTTRAQEVTDATEGNQESQESQESQENHDGNNSGESTDMVEGHLDPAQLGEMNKDDLKKLAKDMGVDLPRGAAKALIVERLAAAIVRPWQPLCRLLPDETAGVPVMGGTSPQLRSGGGGHFRRAFTELAWSSRTPTRSDR
ncbi:MAG: hypothetical protein ACLSUF_03715 [Oscillospiraceae bacterium]